MKKEEKKICIEKKLDNLKKKTEEKRVKTETKSSQSVDVEERPVPALTEPSVPNETAGEIVECSICAEVIYKFVPTYFFGVDTNPACDGCKGSDVETESQSEENFNNAATNLDKAAENDIEIGNEEVIERTRRKIRPKVKAKLEIKLRNGEISEDVAKDLEEELVQELQAELEKDFEEELGRRSKIT